MSETRSRVDAISTWLTTVVLTLALGLVGWAWIRPGTPQEAPQAAPEVQYAALSQPSAPTRIVYPKIKVRAPIVPIQVDENAVLNPPADPSTIGWWDQSAKPGMTGGQTVMTGHSVHTGGGELDRLRKARAGDRVDVVTSAGRLRYQVQKKVVWSYAEVAERYRALFAQGKANRGRLVLITCTDWDGTKWNSNVIVFAKPLGVPTRADS